MDVAGITGDCASTEAPPVHTRATGWTRRISHWCLRAAAASYLKQTLMSVGKAELPGICWNGVKRAAAGVCARRSSE